MNKVIHQMWFQGVDQIPERYTELMASWKETHPDYEYRFWDETSISAMLKHDFPEYYLRWKSLDKLIKKCDAARCFVLFRYGGVYADLDTQSFRSIDCLLKDLRLNDFDIVLSEESYDPKAWKSAVAKQLGEEHSFDVIVGNAILISKKGHPFWLSFLDRSFDLKDNSVLESFSTWHLTRYLESYEKRSDIAVISAHHLLSTEYHDESTYAIHKYDATWFDHSKEQPWDG